MEENILLAKEIYELLRSTYNTQKESVEQGEITIEELERQAEKLSTDIAISEGRIIKLTPEEARKRDEENKRAISDPEYIEKEKQENRQKYIKKVRRKGNK